MVEHAHRAKNFGVWQINRRPPESSRVQRRFTRDEVVRILGVTRRQLDYWARLRLIMPELRWGERFYNFADLVALDDEALDLPRPARAAASQGS